jgi:hypothetical protein
MLRIEHDAAEGVKKHHRYPWSARFSPVFQKNSGTAFGFCTGKRSLDPQGRT